MRFLIGVLLATTFAGCGLFDTRPAENPINAGSLFEPATTPTLVLRNIESALTSANAADYRKCFSDTSKGLPTFVFLPSIQGIAASPTAFNKWGPVQEEEYFENIIAELRPGELSSVRFTPNDVTGVPIGDSIRYDGSYIVRFPHTREGAFSEAEGRLQFTLRRSLQNEWYIVSWRDNSISGKPSWSEIKARFVDR